MLVINLFQIKLIYIRVTWRHILYKFDYLIYYLNTLETFI